MRAIRLAPARAARGSEEQIVELRLRLGLQNLSARLLHRGVGATCSVQGAALSCYICPVQR